MEREKDVRRTTKRNINMKQTTAEACMIVSSDWTISSQPPKATSRDLPRSKEQLTLWVLVKQLKCSGQTWVQAESLAKCRLIACPRLVLLEKQTLQGSLVQLTKKQQFPSGTNSLVWQVHSPHFSRYYPWSLENRFLRETCLHKYYSDKWAAWQSSVAICSLKPTPPGHPSFTYAQHLMDVVVFGPLVVQQEGFPEKQDI